MNNSRKQKNREKTIEDDLDRWRGESPAAGRVNEIQAASKKQSEHEAEPPQRREASKT